MKTHLTKTLKEAALEKKEKEKVEGGGRNEEGRRKR